MSAGDRTGDRTGDRASDRASVSLSSLPPSPLAHHDRHGFVIGLAGWSGSGKTTLAEKLIATLCERGLDVATVKHAHHRFDADIPGKDSYRHRQAGAAQVLVSSDMRSVLFSEHQAGGDRPLDDLLADLRPCDVVVVEGFKREAIPKIEVFRAVNGKSLLFPDDDWIIAVASDVPPDNSLPITPAPQRLDLNDAEAIADFICALADSDVPKGAAG